MPPSKQKSNERQAARDRKSSAASGSTGASAYNPSSGTFHMLEPLNPDIGAAQLNGRFKSIDDTDDNASSNGGCDSMSNNGSYSGESEDQLHTSGKDKNGSGKPGTCGADKRDKIRGKNERKHQRQKERRAQELRDQCTSYLMSRKLEALAQKLVVMGFSQERATMALIVNDGHVEQSVAWLLEGGEGQLHEDWNTSGNPKIDISEELGHILEIEKKYNFSRPDIERAIVSCEGDLDKALECLRARGRSTSPSHEEDHKAQSRSLENVKEEPPSSWPTMPHSPVVSQSRSNAALQPSHQLRRDERVAALASEGKLHASSFNPYVSLEGLLKGPAHLRKHPNPSTDPQSLVPSAEKRGFVQGPFPPVSVKAAPLVSPFTSAVNGDTCLVFGSGTPDPRLIYAPIKDYIQNAAVKEPVYAGQLHSLTRTSVQPTVAPNNCPGSSPAYSSSSWSHGFMEDSSLSSVHVNGAHGDMGLQGIRAARNSTESFELGPLDSPGHLNPYVARQLRSQAAQWNGLGKGSSYEFSYAPSNFAVHSGSPSGTSYGLFTGWGVAGVSQSSVDWSTGPMQNCDYRNIDWSMNASPSSFQGVSSQLNSMMLQEKMSHQWNLDGEKRFQTNLSAARFLTESTNTHGIWKVDSSRAGMQDKISTAESGNITAHEWASPFAGKSLFNLPQAVSSPSL